KNLQDYEWPGNIRELKNVVERAVYQSEDPDAPIRQINFDPFASPYRPLTRSNTVSTRTPAMPPAGEDGMDSEAAGFKQQVQEYEKKLLRDALRQCQFNQRKAARLLDLTYDQL